MKRTGFTCKFRAMDTSEKIKYYREKKGWSHQDLADALGVKYQSCQQWEDTPPIGPKRTRLPDIAKALGTTDDLLPGELKDHQNAIREPDLEHNYAVESNAKAESKSVLLWEHVNDLPEGEFVLIPKLDVKAAAGNGYENHDWPQEEKKLAYRTDFIKRSHAKTTKLTIITVSGTSMQPTLWHDDDVLVDMDQNEISNGTVYAFVHNNEVKVKRLYLQPGKLIIHSDNDTDPLYKYDEEVTGADIEQVKIIGRVVNRSGIGNL